MAQEIQLWKPSIGSPNERKATAIEALKFTTSPQAAIKAAKQLVGCWPHARPADPETYAAALAAVLAQYPAGVVAECCDPRVGLARKREFPPTVACVVEWCDERVEFHRRWSTFVPHQAIVDDYRPVAPEVRERVGALIKRLADHLRAGRPASEFQK